MGLFTDKCTNSQCDNRVPKGALHCNRCNAPAPRALARCGACDAEVRLTSRFCWRCGAELADVARPFLPDGRWVRHGEDFAVRVDGQDLKGWLAKGLVLEHGTRALLFQAGAFKGELPEGRHDLGGFLNRLNHFLIDQDASVVLIDAGDVTIDLENGALWTADRFEVGTSARLVLRLADPDALFVNLFKGRSRVGVDALELQLAGEVQMLLAAIVGKSTAEELFAAADIPSRIEEPLRAAVSRTLERLGLELAQVRFIRFVGAAYEELRGKRGQVAQREAGIDLAAERGRLNRRLREVLSQDKMDAFKSDKDFEEFIRQTEHELAIKAGIRQDEMERLKDRFRFERDREAILRRLEIDSLADDQQRQKAWKDLLEEERSRDERHRRDLERQLAAARTKADQQRIELELQRLEHNEDMRQAEAGLAVLERTKKIEQDEADRRQHREEQKLAAFGKAPMEAMLAFVDGPAADRLAQLEVLRRQQALTVEQLLAVAAAGSTEAARVLAQKYQADGQVPREAQGHLEKRLAEQRQMGDLHAERLERIMRAALEQLALASQRRGEAAAAVIMPPAGCGVAVGPNVHFTHCPQCGRKT